MYRSKIKSATAAILFALTGCGGGSGSSNSSDEGWQPLTDSELPTAEISFPATNGFWSDSDKLIVYGTARDNQGVAEVSVNGIEATSSDGFANWRAEINLDAGAATDINVAVTDINGNRSRDAATVRVNSYERFDSYRFCGPVAYDPAQKVGYVFNPVTELHLFNGSESRVDVDLNNISASMFDLATGRFLVVQNDELLFLDAQFNPIDVVSPAEQGGIPLGDYPQIDIDESSGIIYVLNPWSSYLVKIDPVTGERTKIFIRKESDGSDIFDATAGFVIDSGRFFVTTEHALIELNPDTWSATEISGTDAGAGPAFDRLSGLSINLAQGKAYVGDVYSNLFEIDLATGNRLLISSAADGAVSNLTFDYQKYGLIDTGPSLVINSCLNGQSFTVDKTSGERSPLGNAIRGTGPFFVDIESLVFDRFHERLFVINDTHRSGRGIYPDQDTIQQIMSVDPIGGERRVVTGPYRGSGDPHGSFNGIAVDGRTGDIFVSEANSDSILRIDPNSGDRAVISGSGMGAGPELHGVSGLGVDEKRNQLLVLASIADEGYSLLAVDLDTGDRSMIVGQSTGTSEQWAAPTYMAVDQASDRVYISDFVTRTIYQVDLKTGLKSRLSGEGIDGEVVGNGPDLHEPSNLALDLINNRLLVENYMRRSDDEQPINLQLLAIDLSTGDRKSLIKLVQRQSEHMVLVPAVDPQSGTVYLSMPNIGVSVFDDKAGQYLMLSQ